jgi:hypothetical protein
MNFADMIQGLTEPQQVISKVTYRGDNIVSHKLHKIPRLPEAKAIARKIYLKNRVDLIDRNIYRIERRFKPPRYEVRVTIGHHKRVIYSGINLEEAIQARDNHVIAKPRRMIEGMKQIPRNNNSQHYSNKVIARGVFEIYYAGSDAPFYKSYTTFSNVKKLVYEGTDKEEAIRLQKEAQASKPRFSRKPSQPLNMIKSTLKGVKSIWTDTFGYRYLVKTQRGCHAVTHYYGGDINAAELARANYELLR